ncbi:MAG: N-acetylmuramoyl-L-alanine amidase [Candidatus Omnitrophica bacterium]|nr:N-acetylmuramoyl-L-alanine amidase [Candidatus Omnitrophota bacterium]
MFKLSKKTIFLEISIFLTSFLLTSCATVPKGVEPLEVYPKVSSPVLRQDVFHVVSPGETLWRISKMYDVDMQEIMRVNNIKNPTTLEMGQRLIIPQAAPLRPVIPLYKTDKWKYVIIHHSATDTGNGLSLFDLHMKRGFQGTGYHFVIDNGTEGKLDGQIEATPRWIKQRDGAHCRASGMNYKGIGVCLVGNFSKEKVSSKQLESLVYLVNILRRYYHIPLRNILGHGQVTGARTECPGKNFPWKEFYAALLKEERKK